MNKTYITLFFEKEESLNKIIEAEFYLNNQKVICFTPAFDGFFRIDFDTRRIITDLRSFGFSRLDDSDKMRKENKLGFNVGKSTFMMFMMYCAVDFKYTGEYTDKNTVELIADIMKILYTE